MDKNTKLYQDFVKLYNSAYPSKSGASCQVEANEIWKNRIKEGKVFNADKYDEEVNKLKTKVKKIEDSSRITKFFKKKDNNANNVAEHNKSKLQMTVDPELEEEDDNFEDIYDSAGLSSQPPPTTPEAPAQEKIKAEIAQKEKILSNLIESRNLDN